jgi:hypothetical protein
MQLYINNIRSVNKLHISALVLYKWIMQNLFSQAIGGMLIDITSISEPKVSVSNCHTQKTTRKKPKPV